MASQNGNLVLLTVQSDWCTGDSVGVCRRTFKNTSLHQRLLTVMLLAEAVGSISRTVGVNYLRRLLIEASEDSQVPS